MRAVLDQGLSPEKVAKMVSLLHQWAQECANGYRHTLDLLEGEEDPRMREAHRWTMGVCAGKEEAYRDVLDMLTGRLPIL